MSFYIIVTANCNYKFSQIEIKEIKYFLDPNLILSVNEVKRNIYYF